MRILDAATAVFATMGYEGASTRHLAAEAGVNQPAIQYHFVSKEGLYRAAVERIAGDIEAQMSAPAADIAAALQPPISEKTLTEALLGLLGSMADMVLDEAERETQSLFITRAELENSCMLEPMAEVIARCIITPCATAFARLTGTGERESCLRALAIVGQILNFKNKCLGGAIRRNLGLGEFDKEMKQTVKTIIREQTLAILAGAKARTGNAAL